MFILPSIFCHIIKEIQSKKMRILDQSEHSPNDEHYWLNVQIVSGLVFFL